MVPTKRNKLMSFYDNSSLAFLPSSGAGKDGKAYSIKPTDGTGDFTFSRGSNLAATRVGPTGLIEKGRENLLLQSNQFDTTWTTPDANITSGQADKDGGTDAWLLTATGAFNRVVQSISQSGVKRFSVYAKASTNDYLLLGSFEGAHFYATFNLATGAVDSNNINAISPSIENVGNGWYRCSATWVGTTTDVRIASQATSGQGGWATTTSGSVYIQDAQVEIGLAATDYIESGATTGKAGLLEDEPRFDYSGGATCPSLLLEPSRTNLATHSEYFGAWNTSGTASVTDNQAVSPEGVLNAALLDFGSTTLGANRIDLEPSISAGTDYVFSVFVKNIDANRIGIRNYNSTKDAIANFDFSSASFTDTNVNVIDTIVEPYDNDWYRIGIVVNSGVDTTADMRISPDTTSGSDGEQIYIYGATFEEGSYPTSYIPNHSGGTITRGADVMQIASGISDLLPQGTGTMYVEVTIEDAVNTEGYLMRIEQASFANTIFIARSTAGNLFVSYRNNNSTIFSMQKNNVAKTFKAAFAFESGNSVLYVNGEQVGTSSVTYTPSVTYDDIRIGGYSANTANMSGLFSQGLVFKTRLSNEDLATLTTI